MSKSYTFPCRQCGEEFTASRSDARFCSGTCTERHRRAAAKRRDKALREIVDGLYARRAVVRKVVDEVVARRESRH